MKDYQKQIVWVDYFDSSLSRSAGRRVPSYSATKSPTLEELLAAAQNLGLQPTAHQARRPSSLNRTGYVQVNKTLKKTQLLKKLTEELVKVRTESRKRSEIKPSRTK